MKTEALFRDGFHDEKGKEAFNNQDILYSDFDEANTINNYESYCSNRYGMSYNTNTGRFKRRHRGLNSKSNN